MRFGVRRGADLAGVGQVTTSGTFSYDPSVGSLTVHAFNMCGIRPSSLLQEHLESARMASNMILGRWSAMGVNTWQVDLQVVPLVQGQATYNVPSNTIVMLDAYIVTTSGGVSQNRLILPISRSEYASYSQPQQQGFPTVFWMDRLLAPTVTLYYVPDGTQTSLNYYRLRQSMDAGFTNAQQPEVPYYWTEAFALALAQRLAVIWAPERAMGLKALTDEAYQIAANQDVETSNWFVSPMIGGYFRV